MVYTDHTDHSQTGHRNQTGIINGRYTLDSLRKMIGFLLDDSTRSIRIESILYQNRNILVADWINGRRINNLSTEITKFHGFHITQFGNRISGTDHTGIGSHETVHIRPDFQNVGIQRRSNNGSRIIGSATSQIGHFTGILVGRNESRNQRYSWYILEGFTDQSVSQLRIQNMLVMFFLGLYKGTRIKPLSPFNKGCNNNRRQAFTVADNRCRYFNTMS